MAEEKAKKSNKNLIYIIAGAIAGILIAVTIILIINSGKIDDSFFVSTDTKYVATIEDTSYGAVKNHTVVYNKGEEITGLEDYLEFSDEETAKEIYDGIKELYAQEGFGDEYNIARKGKYLVHKYQPEDYEGLTLSDMKSVLESDIIVEDGDGQNDEANE